MKEYRAVQLAAPTRSPNGGRNPPFSHDQTLDTVLDVEHLTLLHRDLSSPRNPASREQRLLLSMQSQILPSQDCFARQKGIDVVLNFRQDTRLLIGESGNSLESMTSSPSHTPS